MIPPKHESNPQSSEGKDGINRRTIVGAAAWAAPAIALSVASPASATSLGTITATPSAIKAGAPKSTRLQLNPPADNVTISISAEPADAVTFPATATTFPGLGGSTAVLFSTELTEAQTVLITAVAPGYAPVTFPLNIEAAPVIEPEPTPSVITLVDAPEYATFNSSASNRYPVEFALNPPASGVPITLTRERGPKNGLVGFAAYDLISDGSGHARTTVGAMENVDDAPIVRASAPGYETLEFVINTLAAGSPEPTDPGSGNPGSGTLKTHTVYLVSVVGAVSGANGNYVIGDAPIVVTVRLGNSMSSDASKWAVVKPTEASSPFPDAVTVTPPMLNMEEGSTGQFTVTRNADAKSGTTESVTIGNYGTDISLTFTVK